MRERILPLHNEVMLWEGRPLRDIGEADVRRLVESGLEEHLQLEYKSELYDDNDRGRREFLLDLAMFANTAGGVVLIGVEGKALQTVKVENDLSQRSDEELRFFLENDCWPEEAAESKRA